MVFVLDALSRSGTTLLSSLLHSQPSIACYRGVFHEPLACRLAAWPIGYALLPWLERDIPFTFTEAMAPNEARFDPKAVTFYADQFKYDSLEVITREQQVGSLDLPTWAALLERPLGSFSALDDLYEHVRAAHDVRQLGFRWNQGLSYLPIWKSRPGHQWIAMIRNPMDRACSASHIWQQDMSPMIQEAFVYYKKMSLLAEHIDCIIYYEDLVAQPEAELQKVLSCLGLEDAAVEIQEIKHQSGHQYRSESAALIERDGTHKKGMEYSGLYKDRIDIYRSEMPGPIASRFQETLSEIDLLTRYFE